MRARTLILGLLAVVACSGSATTGQATTDEDKPMTERPIPAPATKSCARG